MKNLRKEFQKPRDILVDKSSLSDTYGKFIAEPFERGYGTTLGNALRRVLLSSINGAAVTSVKIEGIVHEFSTLKGVKEDVLNILLNLKNIPITIGDLEEATLKVKKVGPGEVKSGDIELPENVEIADGEVHIATLDEDGILEMEMKVKKGFGYVPAEYNYDDDSFIPIDSVHSPVKKVKYSVENARVGFRTDYEKLILEVWTNGALSPVDAIDNASKILRNHLAIFMNNKEKIEIDTEDIEKSEYWDKIDTLITRIEDLGLSARAKNALTRSGINHLYQIVQKNENELLDIEKLGKKSLTEIVEKVRELGLNVGIILHKDLLDKIEEKINDLEGEEE